MIRSVVGKVMWVGRATVFLVGLAVILALVFGVASTALGKNGQALILGKGKNVATKVTGLIGKVATGSALVVENPSGGSALGLEVNAGKAPLTVNADAGTATNLNADKLDGKDVSEIGVNGWQRFGVSSDSNSESGKQAIARCPSGKVLVGTGYDVSGAKRGSHPNTQTDVVVDEVYPSYDSDSVRVTAWEEEATSANWNVTAYAICAKAP